MKEHTNKTVAKYISGFPKKTQKLLRQLRSVIKKAAPKAEEVISYGIAGYKYNGMLIYFAGFKNHVSVYPAPRNHADFKTELSVYKGGKGTVQFPLDKPLPLNLITRVVKHRLKENATRLTSKKKIKKQ